MRNYTNLELFGLFLRAEDGWYALLRDKHSIASSLPNPNQVYGDTHKDLAVYLNMDVLEGIFADSAPTPELTAVSARELELHVTKLGVGIVHSFRQKTKIEACYRANFDALIEIIERIPHPHIIQTAISKRIDDLTLDEALSN